MTRARILCCFATIAVISLCESWTLVRAPAHQRINGQGDAVREGKTAGEVREVKSPQMPLVWIPAGAFVMGRSKNEADQNFKEDQVRVTISKGFWMGQTEVTRSQWEQEMGTTPWRRREEKAGDDYPATWVSADDAIAFCQRLTKEERRAKRLADNWEFKLPTAAQWEYACRAGTTTRFSFGNDPKYLGLYAWYDANTGKVDEPYAHRVKQKRPNPWNLFDMHGNVSEWCRDAYADKPPGGTDPIVRDPSKLQTVAGGCWIDNAAECLSAWRSGVERTDRCTYEGFRVVLVQTPPSEGRREPNPPAVIPSVATDAAKTSPPIPPLAEPFTMLVFQLRIPKAQKFSPDTDIEFVTEGDAQHCELHYLKAKTAGNYRVFDQEWLIFERARPRRAIMVGPPPWDEKLHTTQVFRLSIPAVPVRQTGASGRSPTASSRARQCGTLSTIKSQLTSRPKSRPTHLSFATRSRSRCASVVGWHWRHVRQCRLSALIEEHWRASRQCHLAARWSNFFALYQKKCTGPPVQKKLDRRVNLDHRSKCLRPTPLCRAAADRPLLFARAGQFSR